MSFEALNLVRFYSKLTGKKPDLEVPYPLRRVNVYEAAAHVDRDFVEHLRYARLFRASHEHDGLMVERAHVVEDLRLPHKRRLIAEARLSAQIVREFIRPAIRACRAQWLVGYRFACFCSCRRSRKKTRVALDRDGGQALDDRLDRRRRPA